MPNSQKTIHRLRKLANRQHKAIRKLHHALKHVRANMKCCQCGETCSELSNEGSEPPPSSASPWTIKKGLLRLHNRTLTIPSQCNVIAREVNIMYAAIEAALAKLDSRIIPHQRIKRRRLRATDADCRGTAALENLIGVRGTACAYGRRLPLIKPEMDDLMAAARSAIQKRALYPGSGSIADISGSTGKFHCGPTSSKHQDQDDSSSH